MVKLILMRHGQSEWNHLNLFTGWVDIPLSLKGVEESFMGGERIKDETIDVIFTSTLIRAEMTAMLAMTKHGSKKTPVILHSGDDHPEEWTRIHSKKTEEQTIPVIRASELNERMYGELQGCNKKELADKFGDEQIRIWRRSFDVPPPDGESLEMTAKRSIPYFERMIIPYLQAGKSVFVVAHGNSLRSLMMKLDGLTPDEVVKLELPTGIPVIYNFKDGHFIKQK